MIQRIIAIILNTYELLFNRSDYTMSDEWLNAHETPNPPKLWIDPDNPEYFVYYEEQKCQH